MRKSKLSVVEPFVAAVLAGMLALSGCSAARERDASRSILEELSKAERLYDRAASLLANPIHADAASGEIAPLSRDPQGLKPEDVKLMPDLSVNPKALADLKQAEADLSKAISANAEADADTKAIAYQMLSRIAVLRGHCASVEASAARERATAWLDQADDATAAVGGQTALIEFYRKLTSPGGETFDKMLSEARAEQTEKEAAIQKGTDAIAALDKEVKGFSDEIARKTADADKLRQEAKDLGGDKGLEKFRASLTIRLEIGETARQSAEKQEAAKDLTAKVDQDRRALEFAKQRIDLAQKMTQDRKQTRDELSKGNQERLGALAKAQEEVEKLAGEVGKECDKAKAAEAEAMSAYEAALNHLKEAQKLSAAGDASENPAEQANVHVRIGDLCQNRLDLQARNDRLMGLMSSADAGARTAGATQPTSTPAAGKLKEYLPEAKAVREAAIIHLGEAVKLYKGVIGSENREVRWLYLGQLAAADMALYRLTKEEQAITDAMTALNEALGDGEKRAGSPFLADVVHLRRLAERLKAGKSSGD